MDYEFKDNYSNEKDFQKDYIKFLKDDWYRVYKLPDIGYTLKPFDIIAVKDWKPLAIELKYWRLDTYDKIYKMLRPNQVWWLHHFQEHWGSSAIIWFDKQTKQVYCYKFKLKDYEWAL